MAANQNRGGVNERRRANTSTGLMSACRGKEKKFKHQTELESSVLTYPGRIRKTASTVEKGRRLEAQRVGQTEPQIGSNELMQSRILQFTSYNHIFCINLLIRFPDN